MLYSTILIILILIFLQINLINSISVKLSTEECLAKGFNPNQLLCSTCEKLDKIIDSSSTDLYNICLSCCINDKTNSKSSASDDIDQIFSYAVFELNFSFVEYYQEVYDLFQDDLLINDFSSFLYDNEDEINNSKRLLENLKEKLKKKNKNNNLSKKNFIFFKNNDKISKVVLNMFHKKPSISSSLTPDVSIKVGKWKKDTIKDYLLTHLKSFLITEVESEEINNEKSEKNEL